MEKETYISGLKEPQQKADLILVNSPINDYTNINRPDTEELPAFGLAYIATECERVGYNVGVLDVETQALSPETAARILNEANPRWIGINLLTPTYSLAKRILKNVNPSIAVAVGAAHAKALPEKVLRDPDIGRKIKVLALEDGEYVMRGLLKDVEPRQMSGIAYIDEKTGEFVERRTDPDKLWIPWNIDELSYADRKFLPNDPFLSEGRTETNMVGSRGCPFNCRFCAGAREMMLFGVRNRTPQNMIGELEMLRDQSVNAVRFLDDLFLANRKRMEGFLTHMIQTGLNSDFVWDATGRANILSMLGTDIMNMIALSGCREISMGIESAVPRVLGVMDKKVTPEMVEESVAKLASVGIRTKGYFILGTPSETREEMEQTIAFMHRLRQVTRDAVARNPITPSGKTNNAQFRGSMFEFRPYPGTALYNYITGIESWPEGIWGNPQRSYMYSEEEILRGFQPVLLEGLEERQKHNYTTDLAFSDIKPSEIQGLIADAMTLQRRDMLALGEYLPGVKN